MDDLAFHGLQLTRFRAIADRLGVIAQQSEHEPLAPLAEQFSALAKRPDALLDEAPALVYRLFTVSPGIAQSFPRDLLWYLGGECLHFMPDEEIERYSALDDARRDAAAGGASFDWIGACDTLPAPGRALPGAGLNGLSESADSP